jgi:hypothetical protein
MFMAYLAWLLNPLAALARTSTHLQNALAGVNRAWTCSTSRSRRPRKASFAPRPSLRAGGASR